MAQRTGKAKLGPLGVVASMSNALPQSAYDDAVAINAMQVGDTANGRGGVVPAAAGGLPLSTLRQTNPAYDARYWARLRALYRGGKRLLADDKLMREIFPPHRGEAEDLYLERRKRAFYIPYAGEIVDHIIAALTAEALLVQLNDPADKSAVKGAKAPPKTAVDVPPDLPPFYDGFVKDCSPPGGEEMNLNQLARATLLEALIVRCAWVMYDIERLPQLPTGEPIKFDSLGQQDAAGALDVYVVPLAAESVIDWEKDASGELEFAMVHTSECRRQGIAGTRNIITERWVYWTRNTWERYELSYPVDKPPKDETIVRRADAGVHTHQRVPMRRLEVPEGLWVMEKLEGLAREHFNKRAGLAWAELQSVMPELYEFLAAEQGGAGSKPIGENQEDPGRAVNQQRGAGFVQVRGGEDRAEFVGPDAAPFAHVLASCTDVRDEMHRVTHQMKLAVDNTAAAMTRSGESKQQDKAAETVVLAFLGLLGREFVRGLLKSVSIARAEDELVDRWKVSGMENFDEAQAAETVDEAVAMAGVEIKSPTFQRLYQLKIARSVLANDASPEDIKAIAEELEQSITEDQFDPEKEAAEADAQREHEIALKKTAPPGKPPGAKP